jgi:hypothetical protein
MTSDPIGPLGVAALPPPPEIHVWTALEREARFIRRGLGMDQPAAGTESDPPRIVAGWAVRVMVIGIKAGQIPDPAVTRRARLIVLAGFGGGLDPALAVADLVLDADEPPKSFDGPWHTGRIVTQGNLVATSSAKSKLFEQTGALAVDMEADPARRAAMLAGVRLLVVRAITDTADQAINPTVIRWIGPTGNVRPGAMTLGLLRRPWLILELIRLWKSSRQAGRRLAEAMRHIVEHAQEFTDSQ